MTDVYVIGTAMTPFTRNMKSSVKTLTENVVESVLTDAELLKEDIQAVWFANSSWGIFEGQHSIRGQVALWKTGIMGVPITNVENALQEGQQPFMRHGSPSCLENMTVLWL